MEWSFMESPAETASPSDVCWSWPTEDGVYCPILMTEPIMLTMEVFETTSAWNWSKSKSIGGAPLEA